MPRARGPLTAIKQDGTPLQSATVAFKESDGATVLAQALYAAATGGSTTTHSTNSQGQLNRYTDYAQRAYYTLNGDSVVWPIDFEVDPADVFAMGADGVTVTQGYRAVARMRIASVEGKIRDRGGRVATVDAYASGVTVNNYAADGTGGDCTAAVTAAIADLVSWGGGTLEYGIGTYKYPNVSWAANVITRGAGRKTTLMHPPNSTTIINLAGPSFTGLDGVGICDITLDGNWENNLDFDSGSAEILVGGLDPFVWNCTVKNFNAFGIQYFGTRPVIGYNRVLGPNNGAGAASYADLNVYQHRYAGRDGILGVIGVNPTTGSLVIGNYVAGLRVASIFVGGLNGTMILNNHVENCQRSWGPLAGEPFGSYSHTGGGHIGIAQSTVSAPSVIGTTTDFTIAGNYVRGTTAPDGLVYASGLELNGCTNGLIENNIVTGCQRWGISLDTTQRITVRGGSIKACGAETPGSPGVPLAGGAGAFRVADNTGKFTLDGVIMSGNVGAGVHAIHLAGTTNHYSISNCLLEGNTTNYSNTSTGQNRKVWGNVAVDADDIPSLIQMNTVGSGVTGWAGQFVNDHARGFGLRVAAGSTAADYALHVTNNSAGVALFDVYGNGQSIHAANIAAFYALAVTNASATGYGLRIAAGSTASEYALHVTEYSNSIALFDIFGTGEAAHRTTATTGILKLDVLQGAAGTYKHILGLRNGATIWGIGSDGGDNFAVWNAALTLQNLTVANGGLVTARNGLTVSAGATTLAGQLIVPVGLVGTPSLVFPGTATGIYSSGADITSFTSNGTKSLEITANRDVVLGTAALATTATGGWLWVSTSAGPPTGVPAGTYTGRGALHIDSTNHKLYMWDGAWRVQAAAFA